MSDSSSSSHQQRLEQLLADYLRAVESGQPLDQAQLVADHPDLAADLQSFFRNQTEFERAARSIRSATGDEATLAPAVREPGNSIPRLRYFGDYELLVELARGGMGVVYRARQVTLNRTVALKMILSGKLASADDVRRFRQEAEAAANLDHPNIVPIFEIGEHEGQQYFSMKLIEGRSLAQALREDRESFTSRRTAELMASVARAVHHAHQRGLLHRDLKPGNILLDVAGGAHVTDFGLAKRVAGDSDLTHSGAILGTPSYMAPEQASASKQLTTAVDVYSLGAVLYEMLAGRPPFQAESSVDVLLQVLSADPKSPRHWNDRIDRDLETICLKCLEKDPQRRYDSAAALAEELDRWLRGEPILARPVGRVERSWRWCLRNPAVTTLLASVAASLLLGTMVATIFAIRSNENANMARDQEKLARAEQRVAELARTRAQWLAYTGQIALSQREWQDGEVGHARELLDTCQWNLRGWEHDFLHTLFNDRQQTFRGHSSAVLCVAFSPNGKRIAASGGNPSSQAPGDYRVRIWDVQTGELLLILSGHDGDVDSLSFNPDGSLLASGGYQIKIWDAQTGQEKMTLSDAISPALFSPDGKRILTSGPNGAMKIWNVESGVAVAAIPNGTTRTIGRSLAWSPDSTRIVGSGGDQSLKIYDATSGESVLDLAESGNHHPAVAFSPDDQLIAGAGYDNAISLWDAKTGKLLRRLQGHREYVSSVAFSPDSRRLCSGSYDKLLIVWDVSEGKVIRTLKGHAAGVASVAFSRDGSRIVSGGYDETVKVWDAAEDQGPLKIQGEGTRGTRSVAVSPEGDRIAVATWYANVVSVFDSVTGQEVRKLPDATHPVVYGRGRIVTGGEKHSIIVWDADTGAAVLTLPSQPDEIHCVAMNRAGTRLVTGSRDNSIVLWDARTGEKLHSLKGHRSSVDCVTFSPNGEEIVSGSFDDTLKVWNVTTGQERLTLVGHISGGGSVLSVAYSPDGRQIVSGSADNTIRIWDSETGREIRTLAGHTSTVDALAFSPDGRRIASGGFDKTLRIWDPESGQTTMILKGHRDSVQALAFTPDGQRLVSGAESLMVWDARLNERSRSIKAHALVVSPLLFSRDGRWLASGGWHDPTAKVWDTRTGQEHVSLSGGPPIAFSPQGDRILTDTGAGLLKLWDVSNGEELLAVSNSVGPAVFSADGQRFTCGGTDKTFKVWKARSGQAMQTIPGPTGIDFLIAISPDGQRMVGSDGKSLKLWASPSGRELVTLTGQTNVAFNADGSQLVAGGTSLAVWDAVTGQQLRTLVEKGEAINGLSWSQNGQWIAIAQQRSIRILNAESGQVARTIYEHGSLVTSLSFSPDSRSLASGSWDGVVRLWTIEP